MAQSPIIDKRVFVCSKFVRVFNLAAGSQVTVFFGSQKMGEIQAGGGEAFVPLDQTINLKAGDKLYAVARLGNQDSPKSEAVPVLAAPALTSLPQTHSLLYAGGTCLGAWGLIPGSLVEVWNGAESLGQAESYKEYAFVPIRPLKPSDAVQVEATHCGLPSGKTMPPSPRLCPSAPDPMPKPSRLPGSTPRRCPAMRRRRFRVVCWAPRWKSLTKALRNPRRGLW